MKKIFFAVVLPLAIFWTSCSKSDESPAPANTTPAAYITYSLTVREADKNVAYDLVYRDNKGLHSKQGITGNFAVRVPAMVYDSVGTSYVRSMMSLRAHGTDAEPPVIVASLKITGDNGFVIAQSATSCGYTERTVDEISPLNWLRIKQ